MTYVVFDPYRFFGFGVLLEVEISNPSKTGASVKQDIKRIQKVSSPTCTNLRTLLSTLSTLVYVLQPAG